MSRRGEPRATRSLAATALATGHKGAGGRPAKKLLRKADNAKALQAQLAFLTAMVAELQDKLEAQAKMPARYEHPLARTSNVFKGKPAGVAQGATGISLPSSTTPRGVEGAEALAAAAYLAHTDFSPSTESSDSGVSRETSTFDSEQAAASVPSGLDGYEKRLEAMGLRVPVPVVPDEIWQFLEGAEAIEDGHLRLQKYQAAMRAFGRYYTQIGEVDRGFQVVLMLTNQMKDMYMARSKSAGGYLVRESELAALEAEISGMTDEELAAEEGKEDESKDGE